MFRPAGINSELIIGPHSNGQDSFVSDVHSCGCTSQNSSWSWEMSTDRLLAMRAEVQEAEEHQKEIVVFLVHRASSRWVFLPRSKRKEQKRKKKKDEEEQKNIVSRCGQSPLDAGPTRLALESLAASSCEANVAGRRNNRSCQVLRSNLQKFAMRFCMDSRPLFTRTTERLEADPVETTKHSCAQYTHAVHDLTSCVAPFRVENEHTWRTKATTCIDSQNKNRVRTTCRLVQRCSTSIPVRSVSLCVRTSQVTSTSNC